MKKEYSKEFKQHIVQEHFAGSTVSALAKEYSLSRNTVYSWIKQHGKEIKRTKPINMREYNDLKQKCSQLEEMVEILQMAPCTVDAPLLERYAFIFSLANQYSVNLLCKTMKVANGARKIHAILKERGYQISPNTVADIMHDNGWFSSRGGAKKLYLKSQERKQLAATYKLNATKPNEIWVGDVTIFKLKNIYYYICAILDICSRKIVGYRISTCNSTHITKAAFKMAYENRQPEKLHFHSDQGANYIARTYVDYLKGY